jgi:SulP family sulfate permease
LKRGQRRIVALARDGFKDAIAGLVASVVLVANIVSFGALMFPGELSAGIPMAIWAMLVGSCIGGAWIAWATSLPPLASGIDSPTGAVLVLLSATAGSGVIASGGNAHAAVEAVMMVFTISTFISGLLLFGLGARRWGSYFRFVPYFVVGGFLAATGWLLISGGIRMTTGASLALLRSGAGWTVNSAARLASAAAALLVLFGVRRWIKSVFAMPFTILFMPPSK